VLHEVVGTAYILVAMCLRIYNWLSRQTQYRSVRAKHHLLGQLQAFSGSMVVFEVRQLAIA
jgi:hypothetical protein